MNSIEIITENILCTGCGACSGICPTYAVGMVINSAGFIVAQVDNKKCVHCGRCLEVCPSNNNNRIRFEGEDIFHGVCLEGYVGFAKDEEIRKESQSGGIVTALLCFLLEKKIIDGAIVNNFNNETRRPQAVLALTKDEIVNGCGSYYSQTSVVKTILENNKDKKLAAVVLGCQAASLNLMTAKDQDNMLPLYTIGLICAGQNSGYMIDDLLEMSGCNGNKEKIVSFRFRDKRFGGWPGNISISTSKTTYNLSNKNRIFLKSVYEHPRCIPCFDQMNIFSDIACGDPWNIFPKHQPEGHTVVIARTERGQRLLEDAKREGAISLDLLSVESIIRGQTVDTRQKTKFFTAKDSYKENAWVFPYKECYFDNIPYNYASNKEKKDIMARLSYSRKLYSTNSIGKIKSLTTRKKLKNKIINLITCPLLFIKRSFRFVKKIHS